MAFFLGVGEGLHDGAGLIVVIGAESGFEFVDVGEQGLHARDEIRLEFGSLGGRKVGDFFGIETGGSRGVFANGGEKDEGVVVLRRIGNLKPQFFEGAAQRAHFFAEFGVVVGVGGGRSGGR